MKENKSILNEIVNKLQLSDRYLVEMYIRGEKIDEENYIRIANLERAMNNQQYSWWLSEYPQERAYRQFFCSTLIMNFDIYIQDMRRLLRRNVTAGEIFNRNLIALEVIKKYREWTLGNIPK